MNNLEQAIAIVRRLNECADVQAELKRAFASDELDGGWKTALDHPVYQDAEAEIRLLQEDLKGLI